MTALRRILASLKAIAGMPDYGRYVAHLQACHPDRPVPDEREYFEQYLKAKYGRGASRCC